MKIGFVKQSWHEPAIVVPKVAYRIYDIDNFSGWPEAPYAFITAEFQKACNLVRNLGITRVTHDHILAEHVHVVIAALRFAGHEVGDLPK